MEHPKTVKNIKEKIKISNLSVELTPRCNRFCSYCYNVWKGDKGYSAAEEREMLDGATWVVLITQVLEATGLKTLQVTGGEPLLRSDLFSILRGIRGATEHLSLVTDGGLIDEECADNFKKIGVSCVQPTLLAGHAVPHNHLKGTECFDQTLAAIGRLLKRKVPVSVAFVCTSQNYQYFQEMIELCFALGIQRIAFNRFCATGEGSRTFADLQPTHEMIAECLGVAQWANSALGMKVGIAVSLPLCSVDRKGYPDLSFGRCSVSSTSPGFTIDPFGNVRSCSTSSAVFGNLVSDFTEISNYGDRWEAIIANGSSEYFTTMKQLPSICKGCGLAVNCGGGCRESALGCYGSLDRADPLVEEAKKSRK